jgi:N-acetylneuraminic acid mutarotase
MNWKFLKKLNQSPFPLEQFKIIQKPNSLQFYLYGGYSSLGNVNSDIYIFNVENMNWKKLEMKQSKIEIPAGRYGHSFDMIQDKIYLFGGKSYCNLSNKLIQKGGNFEDIENILYEFDLIIHRWSILKIKSINYPEERFYHSSCSCGNFLFIHGGYNFGELDDFWKFDIKSQLWIKIYENSKCRPSARYHHQMVSFHNKIYLIGGVFKNSCFKEIWEYDITLNRWMLLSK